MNEVLHMESVASRKMTLREHADICRNSGAWDGDQLLDDLEALVWGDRALMKELHDFAHFDVRAALAALLRELERSGPAGEDRSRRVEKTKVRMSSPALSLDALTRAKRTTAVTMLMVIDGTPLGEWTVGRCRTQARRKSRQAEMLRQVLRHVGHLPDTTEVGAVLTDERLREIAASIQ